MKLVVDSDNIRIDIYLKDKLDITRTKAQRLIDDEKVLVNGRVVSSSYKVHLNDEIEYTKEEEFELSVDPEKMDLDIVFEDKYLMVINKPSGLVVHPAVGNYSHTLVNGLLYHFNNDNKENLIRPGIVHRLDKDTSGLMLVAKDENTHVLLSEMIKEKKVERVYEALVWGVVKHERGTIDAPIGRDINNRQKYNVTNVNAKDSVTHFRVVERYKEASLLECKLDTGRTHQIRVHMNYINHPIVNDEIYCNKKIFNPSFGQMLHSKYIKFNHPITKEELTFKVNPPQEFLDILNIFKD